MLGEELLDLAGSADFLELGNHSLGIVLGDGFLDGLGSVVDELLGFLQTQAGDLADDLDDLDLLGADLLQDDVELGLLFDLSSAGGGSSDSGSSGGNAEGLFQSMDELSQLEDAQGLNFFNQGIDFFASHFKFLLNSE